MNLIKTGITKLDEYFGGFPEGRSVLLTGDAGAGKTIFGLQFARSNCAQGKKTLYMSTEEISDDLRLQAKFLNLDLENYEKEGLLEFLDVSVLTHNAWDSNLRVLINKGNISSLLDNIPEDTQTLIIDNIGGYISRDKSVEFMGELDTLNYNLYTKGITALLVLDNATLKEFNDIALYSCHGSINLMKHENPYTGKRERVMDIVKMRNCKTPVQLVPYEISVNGGIEITSIIE